MQKDGRINTVVYACQLAPRREHADPCYPVHTPRANSAVERVATNDVSHRLLRTNIKDNCGLIERGRHGLQLREGMGRAMIT